jgi:N-methylhydantoinase A
MGADSAEAIEHVAIGEMDPRDALSGSNNAWLKEAGGWIDLPVYDGVKLRPGHLIKGPALVQEAVTINYIPFEAIGQVTAQRGLMINLLAD